VSRLHNRLKKFQMAMLFAVIIFILLLFTMLLMLVGIFVLSQLGIVKPNPTITPFFMFAIFSIIVGTIVAMVFSRFPLSPLREIISASDRLAEGDFDVRINLRGPEELQNLNSSFNHMAEELGSIEMLRSDFVNNFSHEFKTPIVSVRGFAKILKYEDLTKEERDEYLDIIIYESERLAELATNVLNLSKVENQMILKDKTCYNGSEQIRRIIAILENKWAEKNIEILFDYDEINVCGNEELLNQLWTNLLDNAIKFSPENSTITINISQKPEKITITFTDQGIGISQGAADRIFDKFYQGDTSHATKGNGIGLTIAKRIVELHEGSITVKSNDIGTSFIVELPMYY
jgi:signal transduction histidine kinase